MITHIKYPSRVKGLMIAVLFSVLAHAAILLAIRVAPIVSIAMGFSGIEWVDDPKYNKTVIIDISKWMKYPPGYLGFRPPQKTKSLDDIKKEKERIRRLEERRKRERELAEKRKAEEKAKADEKARAEMANAEPKPTPTPRPDSGYGSFGKINTAPIKDQIQRLYQAKKDGKLRIPDGKFKVGVSGTINPDGTLADYHVHIPSGIPEIDDSAMAILAAVSESRALGPLSKLTSITMVLDIDQEARLTVIGFTSTETDASNLHNLADIAVFAAKRKKGDDPTAMVMLNNLDIKHAGNRIQAVIKVPKEMAKETLSKSMDK
jgi:hypothetical protein